MREEIGSEFWSIPISKDKNSVFGADTKWYISGTSALSYILSDILQNKIVKTASLPSWCCSSMVIPFLRRGIEVSFYPVWEENGNFRIDCSEVDSDIIFIMDYFGYKSEFSLPQNYDGIVIRDMTHSIFRKQNLQDADYYFGSLRKWAGFWTGGYAYSSKWNNGNAQIEPVDEAYIAKRETAMRMKLAYIDGKTDDKSFLQLFDECEDFLDQCDIFSSTQRDIDCAFHFDINFVRKRRIENASRLLKTVRDIALFPNISLDDCPLFVPIVLPYEKRNALKKYLIDHHFYCPTHWPIEDVHKLDDLTKGLYLSELSLVCDQRYTVSDMDRLSECIESFFNQ